MERANKKNGKITNTWKATVSPDGNALRFENTYTCSVKSAPITIRKVYTRVAKGPAGSHAISGSWEPVKASGSENDLQETWKVEGDRSPTTTRPGKTSPQGWMVPTQRL